MPRSLDGAVAIVTGASRGIGRALTQQLAARGCHVWAIARSESLAELDTLDNVTTRQVDVTSDDEVEAFARAFLHHHDAVDILVNNAGVLGPRSPLREVGLQAWLHTIDVNLHGVFRVTSAFLNDLAPGGIIVNVSSSVGRKGRGGWGPYSVSKHGVEGLSGTLADELLDEGITVVSVNPGGTATEMRAEAYPDEDPSTLPTADEVAATFVSIIESTELDQTGAQLDSRDFL
jgi:NAD(P)-dependent dehydrogenase (short-subunit alcohol dehydrogenase family)